MIYSKNLPSSGTKWLPIMTYIHPLCIISNVWNTQGFINYHLVIEVWHSSLENSSTSLDCKLFNDTFETEITSKFLGISLPLKHVDLGSQIISFLLNKADGIT